MERLQFRCNSKEEARNVISSLVQANLAIVKCMKKCGEKDPRFFEGQNYIYLKLLSNSISNLEREFSDVNADLIMEGGSKYGYYQSMSQTNLWNYGGGDIFASS